jgi:diguanylate cyclase (GGDEF)-like protein/PAS domain S-box-containing protein
MYVNSNFMDHLKLLFENSRDFVFFMRKIGQDYEYVYTNRSATEMLGRDCIGDTVQQAIDKDAAKFIINHYNLAIDKNGQHEFEDYAYIKFSVHKHETTVIPVHIDGEIYVLAITKEISIDRDIQDKYLFMRSVFFKTFLSTVLVKSDGTLIEANPTFLEGFDLQIDDVRGKKMVDLPIFTDQSAKQIQQLITNTNADDRFDTQMLTFIDHNKKDRYYMATFSPISRGDEVTAIFIIFQEVTEYILQKKQLKTTMHGLNMFKRALNFAAEVTITNLKGEIVEVNDRFLERTGYRREELIGKTHNIVNSKYHPPEFFKDLWTTIESGNIWRGEVRNRTKYGEMYWVDTTIIPLTNQEGEVFQYITIHFNVSEKKKMMIELRNIERTFRLITENTNDFIVILNGDGTVSYSSPSYIRKLGYTEEELHEINYEKLIHPDSLQTWNRLLHNSHEVEKDGSIELLLLSKNDDIIWTEGNYTLVYDYVQNMPIQIIMVSREITERKEREDSLMFLAYHDSLTQLPNRRYLQKEFPQFIEYANTNFESFAVLYIDGDNFKLVNDCYGHDIGDIFLMNFGKALLKSVRKSDLVVRMGGDEFLILVSNLSRDKSELEQSIHHVLKNIRENLKKGWQVGNIVFEPTASIGVSIYPFDGVMMDELLENADRALYQAKQMSKNTQSIPYFHK